MSAGGGGESTAQGNTFGNRAVVGEYTQAPAASSGGQFIVQGSSGENCLFWDTRRAASGNGGSSFFGGGARGIESTTPGSGEVGVIGGGASGSMNAPGNGSGRAGRTGGAGLCVITEFLG